MDSNSIIQSIPETGALAKADTYTTSNGVVFRVKPVPPFLMRDAQRKHTPPRPPLVYIQDKETQEENPSDPDYLEAVADFNAMMGELSNAITVSWGTELISVPDGMPKPGDDSWLEDIAELIPDIQIPNSGKKRYYCWIKYVVLTTVAEFRNLFSAVERASGGVSEEDVAAAASDFRGVQEGDADNGVSADQDVGQRDSSAAGLSGVGV